jgi:sulfite oxidase
MSTDHDAGGDRARKHPAMSVRQEAPFNGGPPLWALASSFVTPTDLFFVRSHAGTPDVDPQRYRLAVGGLVRRPLSLSLADLAALPHASVRATLQCAGNRRDELLAVGPVPDELAWGADAISTAEWSGVPLSAVLAEAGVEPGAAHVAFESLDTVERGGSRFSFGGSVPLAKALAGEVLLADRMNGEPLAPAHGFPLRVVVPGYIGARSVKWLGSVVAQAAPSDNYFQAHAYKLFPPGVTPETVDWSGGLMLGELSVTAAICAPTAGARVPAGPIAVSGYAMAGGGRTVERVDLSADGGHTWAQAQLGEGAAWTWRLWRAEVELAPGPCELVVRAWDSAANTQPEAVRSTWNFKGYMNNAWHRVAVIAE